MTGFTDLHHHCLWGMDDGARDFEESCRMLKLAAEDGITTLAATVHVCPGQMPFHRELYFRRLEDLRQWVKEEGLPLTLLEGTEIWYSDKTLSMLREKRILTLGGTPYVLVEFSHKVTWPVLEQAVQELFRGGYIPVVAHIERYWRLYWHTADLMRLRREVDVCFQVNAGSVIASRDPPQRVFLNRMLRAKAVDLVATDAHDERYRASHMRGAFASLETRYGRAYAMALTGFRMEEHLKILCNG